jgi:N-acetyl sugar amidotransferase
MDTTDPTITFDADGVCSHCHYYEREIAPRVLSPELARQRYDYYVGLVKHAGRGRKYDCVLGISGGIDSSYLAYLAMTSGLRALLVHMDNGWDSELAVKNIENIVRRTGFDYFNHVVDWEEFKDVQLAYLRAGVVDVEVVTDHAISALLYQTAVQFDVKYFLSGVNFATECIMPRQGWLYPNKMDLVNLRAIHQRYGRRKLRTYPTLGYYRKRYYEVVYGIDDVWLLNYVDYRLEEVFKTLRREFDWRYYGRKHGESVFTKFYQAYILPRKFNVDKRKAHLSNQICSGQLTRELALIELAKPNYPEAELKEDYAYAIKKLGLTKDEFEAIMNGPVVPHEHFPTMSSDPLFPMKDKCWYWMLRVWRRVRRGVRPKPARFPMPSLPSRAKPEPSVAPHP